MNTESKCKCHDGEFESFKTSGPNTESIKIDRSNEIVIHCSEHNCYCAIPAKRLISSKSDKCVEVIGSDYNDTGPCRKCDGELKDFFTNHADAALVARQIERMVGEPHSAYECVKCGFWHCRPSVQSDCHHCQKTAYATEEAAKAAANYANTSLHHGPKLRVYKCRFSEHFHLTKK